MTKPTRIRYDIQAKSAPQMPKCLPKMLSVTAENVPKHMKPAVMNSVFPAFGALMHNVTFRYNDNVLHEPHFMCGIVGPQSVGKGAINPVIEAIIHSIRAHDDLSNRKLQEWKRQYKSAGANKQKPERPTDAAILAPEPDMTNPALILLLMDAEAEGNRFLYTNIPEVDQLDQCCGGHRKLTRVIRLAYDNSRYGAQRATADGISGSPVLRWNFNFSCVGQKAQQFFKECLQDGTLSRIGLSYVQRPEDDEKTPQQGIYDDAYRAHLDAYLVRLQAATGEIACPQANKLAQQIKAELVGIISKTDNDCLRAFAYRAAVISWLKACVLYVGNGQQWSAGIAAFQRWSAYYDMWSKLAIFAIKLRDEHDTIDTARTGLIGPQNMLKLLPEIFSFEQLIAVRVAAGKSEDGAAEQLRQWKSRGYIEPLQMGNIGIGTSFRKLTEE